MNNEGKQPLPIWFFVGVILFVYGILVIVGQAMDPGGQALKSLKPGFIWGPVMIVFGVIFTAIKLVAHKRQG